MRRGMGLASRRANSHPPEAMMSVRLFLPLIFAFPLACGGSSDSEPVPLSAVSVELATAMCERVFRCCDQAQRTALSDEDYDLSSVETCKASLEPELRGEI